MEKGIERLLLDHNEVDDDLQSTVPVHICFDLEDKPQELLNALEKIKVNSYIINGVMCA